MDAGTEAFAEGRSTMTFTDKATYTYLLGDDIFVAPFLEGGTQLDITFPDGSWIYAFGDGITPHSGGTTEALEIPISEVGVFVRQGSEIADVVLNR